MANTHALDLELSSSQYAARVNTASLSITGDFTIECWVNLEQMPSASSDMVLVAKFTTGGNKRSYVFRISTADKMQITYSGDGTNTTYILQTTGLSDITGTWTHLAAAVDVSAKTAVMYVDGSSVASDAGVGTQTAVQDNDSDFNIGAAVGTSPTRNSFLDGIIDDVRVWNDIRTEAEVQDNRSLELDGDEAGLVGYWKFNDNYDDSQISGNNDLTASGSPVFSTDIPFPLVTFVPKVIMIL